ncbi:mechanosensitive ion channel family protein [Natranaeroarchaeum sulfidigenes]|uniref:Small-conductance mechanosensitive channel n=1 Tax=Natranaeroarchaeum sulfidigenes TaxID=2784880 RepID=A0A897MT28_9EURY|nr:mechanosensitive ion channel family protein [Natranaeroarchaeum sulfidigenes]QSG01375.1 Small-conductance mechanosensitive channel [Natranaeroarchaeum sulfidigenes]
MQALVVGVVESVQALSVWRQVAVVILSAAALATAVEIVARWWLNRRSPDDTLSIVFEILHVPLYLSVILGGAYTVVQLLQPPRLGFLLEGATLSVLVILWAWGIRRLGAEWFVRLDRTNPVYDIAPVLKNLWTATIVAVAAGLLLAVWEVDLTPLLASAGLFGIIIGFAARDAIANFVGGIALFVDDTYKPGDFVVLESGDKGTVIDISLRSTTILTRDRVMVTVPNAVLNSTQVINESSPQRYKRMRVPVGVEYGADPERVEEIFYEVLDAESDVMSSPPTEVRFVEFGDSALQFELRGYIPHSTRESRARHAVNKRIHRRLAEEGIEIPYPQRTLTYGDDDDKESQQLEDAELPSNDE